jgi:hypothetical protein
MRCGYGTTLLHADLPKGWLWGRPGFAAQMFGAK